MYEYIVMADELRCGVEGPVCVTGASGFIGSWLVMRLLQQGFTVRATVRDPGNLLKTKHLLDLPAARDRLTLWRGDLEEEGSFDGAFDGCRGVFHVATPMDFHSQNPEEEVIRPTVEGVLNVMRSCAKAKSVRRVVFTSSAGTVLFVDNRAPGQVLDESCWTNVLFCRRHRMTGWMYFVSKTLAEKAAWEFAEQHKIDLVTVIPTLVVGPFIMPAMPPSLITALAPITRNEAHYSILRQVQVVHVEDVCNAHIFVYRHAEAKGRYICSSHDTTILEIAKMLAQKYPQYDVPTQWVTEFRSALLNWELISYGQADDGLVWLVRFEGADESLEVVRFSSEKLTEMGFKYQYSMEDMFEGAIQSCREKGLI